MSLFNQRLTSPLSPSSPDADAIWATAAALSVLSFSSLDRTAPIEELWPLSPRSDADLAWLRVSNGKMALWGTVQPMRTGSIFRVFEDTYADMYAPMPASGILGISPTLASLCSLNDNSTAQNNSYFAPAHAVSLLYRLSAAQQSITVGHVEQFMRSVIGTFEALLVEKDAVALVLLLLWYEKAGEELWFIRARARVEGRAIREFLRRECKDNRVVQDLVWGSTLKGVNISSEYE